MEIFRSLARQLVRRWGATGIANGYYYQTVEKLGPHLASRPLKARLYTGQNVQCLLREHIQRHMYFFGAYEPVLVRMFESFLQPGHVVIDGGANVGQYSLVAAHRVGVKGKVYSFEPIPKNLEILREHVRINDLDHVVEIVEKGLWNTADGITLYLSGVDAIDNATDYTVGFREDHVDKTLVPTVRLDDFVEENQLERVDMIKLDIEGSELYALQGMEKTVQHFEPNLLIEVNEPNCQQAGYEVEELWDFLKSFGYKMILAGSASDTCRAISSLEGIHVANVLFYKNELPKYFDQQWNAKSIQMQNLR